MQIRLRHVAREPTEEIVAECDCRSLKTFLLLASAGWLIDGAWIFREALVAKAGEGPAPSATALAICGCAAAALVISSIWVAFGRRAATFVAGELRIHSTLGPLRVRRVRVYPLTDICDIRLWFQGVNDRGWKKTNRSIVFDYRDRIVILFSRLPEHAADTLLRDTRRHALAAAPS